MRFIKNLTIDPDERILQRAHRRAKMGEIVAAIAGAFLLLLALGILFTWS